MELLTHTIALVLGMSGGMFITGLFVRAKVRRATLATWRQAEDLHRARAIQDLRDNTSARIMP